MLNGPTLGDLSPDDAASMDDATITLAITFPGAVTDHNGTLNGTTVSWNLITTTDAPHAQGSAIAPQLPWGIIATGLAAAVGSLIGVVVLRRQRRGP